MDRLCWVCEQRIGGVPPHTYHAEGCPARQDPDEECAAFAGCGEDCHPACCPTCREEWL